MTTRRDLRRKGAETRQTLLGPGASPLPEIMRALADEAAFGAVWSRPGLAMADRMLAALAALGACSRLPALKLHVGAALDLGLEPRAIAEVLIQVGIYAGFAASAEALEAAGEVFAGRGLAMPEELPAEETLDELSRRGAELMRKLHGERAGRGYAAPGNAVTGALYPLAIQYGYGAIWFRPGLALRQRALVAVAGFTALKLDAQAGKFALSALNMGLSEGEVIEAMIQTAPLTGFAPALNALQRFSEGLAERDRGKDDLVARSDR